MLVRSRFSEYNIRKRDEEKGTYIERGAEYREEQLNIEKLKDRPKRGIEVFKNYRKREVIVQWMR